MFFKKMCMHIITHNFIFLFYIGAQLDFLLNSTCIRILVSSYFLQKVCIKITFCDSTNTYYKRNYVHNKKLLIFCTYLL